MTPDAPEGTTPEWRPRLAALTEAQSRYFYLLGASGVFLLALFAGLETTATAKLVGVSVSSALVLATGPAVLGFLIQAVTGTIVATDTAAWQMAVLEGKDFEREHTSPSAIDLAFYTTDRSPVYVRAAGLLIYPAYLTLFWCEGAGLWFWFQNTDRVVFQGSETVKGILLLLGAALLLTALPRLAFLWWRKASHAWVVVSHRNTPVWRSRAMVTLADISDTLRGAGHKVDSRFEGRRYRMYVDDEQVAWGRSLQELTVRTREWNDKRVAEAGS